MQTTDLRNRDRSELRRNAAATPTAARTSDITKSRQGDGGARRRAGVRDDIAARATARRRVEHLGLDAALDYDDLGLPRVWHVLAHRLPQHSRFKEGGEPKLPQDSRSEGLQVTAAERARRVHTHLLNEPVQAVRERERERVWVRLSARRVDGGPAGLGCLKFTSR